MYLMSGEGVIAIGIHRNGINHNRKFCDSPAHNQSPNTKMFFECRSEGDEAADVQWNRKIAGPEFKTRLKLVPTFQ